MRPDSKPGGKGRPSFIEEARRRQIVDTAIKTIAALGYSATSLAEIAREAGISKGVISYHFEGKDELIEEILSRLLREPAAFIKKRVEAKTSTQDKLAAYVDANFEFAKGHRDYLLALVDLWGRRNPTQAHNRFESEAYEPSRRYLSRILENGCRAGEVAAVPAKAMASVIQASIDGVLLQWAFDPNAVDLDACCSEIRQMIAGHVAPKNDSRAAFGT
ncbi:MAG: TetR family transcriptional regulator [Myxococcales bacterium]|nr:TetR family transcriptional regulator [Myxococcales bacterium]